MLPLHELFFRVAARDPGPVWPPLTTQTWQGQRKSPARRRPAGSGPSACRSAEKVNCEVEVGLIVKCRDAARSTTAVGASATTHAIAHTRECRRLLSRCSSCVRPSRRTKPVDVASPPRSTCTSRSDVVRSRWHIRRRCPCIHGCRLAPRPNAALVHQDSGCWPSSSLPSGNAQVWSGPSSGPSESSGPVTLACRQPQPRTQPQPQPRLQPSPRLHPGPGTTHRASSCRATSAPFLSVSGPPGHNQGRHPSHPSYPSHPSHPSQAAGSNPREAQLGAQMEANRAYVHDPSLHASGAVPSAPSPQRPGQPRLQPRPL